MKIILLRNDDTFIALAERLEMVKDKNANFFLSIHCDAFKNKDRRGGVGFVNDKYPFKDLSSKSCIYFSVFSIK
jgi:N-acetylmuramoyl-L-alanine amidase